MPRTGSYTCTGFTVSQLLKFGSTYALFYASTLNSPSLAQLLIGLVGVAGWSTTIWMDINALL